jgi:hypothetical protein
MAVSPLITYITCVHHQVHHVHLHYEEHHSCIPSSTCESLVYIIVYIMYMYITRVHHSCTSSCTCTTSCTSLPPASKVTDKFNGGSEACFSYVRSPRPYVQPKTIYGGCEL